MQHMLKKLEQTIQEQRLLEGVTRLLVGVSGGADSVALITALVQLQEALGVTLVVAHLNHLIRGEDAEADERFVHELAESLSLRCVSARVDVPALCRGGGVSLEMAARNARQAFFADMLTQEQCEAVAVAHTADDQVETILLRLFRGCGLLGLSGIPYRNVVKGCVIVRPMRDVTHAEAVHFLQQRNRPWREDATNQDTDFMRNRVRHEILPMLEKRMNPKVRGALLRMSDIVRADNDWLDLAAGNSFTNCCLPGSGKNAALSIERLNRLPLAEQRRVIMKWLADQHVDHLSLDLDAIRRIEQLTMARKGSKAVSLKAGWQVTRIYNRLVIQRKNSARNLKAYRVELILPGTTDCREYGFVAETEQSTGIIRQKNTRIGTYPLTVTLNAEEVKYAPLYVRSWRYGDVFNPLGMEGHKKVQDIFVDRKVPRTLRAVWPLVECRGQLVWIPGYQIAQGWELPGQDAAAVKITLRTD